MNNYVNLLVVLDFSVLQPEPVADVVALCVEAGFINEG